MARLFVRLKLRILRNRLGSSSAMGVVGFVLVWVAALGAGVGGGALLAVAGRLVVPSDAIPPIAFTLVSLGWVIGPVLAASFDDTLDPRRFELLPIDRTQLGVGLTLAGLIGPGGVGTALGLLVGTVIGFAGPASVVPIVLTALVQVLLAVVTARFLLTALADVLRARRAREILGIAVGLLAAIPAVFAGMINTGVLRFDTDIARATAWLVWFPPGALGRAVVAFRDGDWWVGLGGWVYGLAAVTTVVWGYGWALDRLQVVADAAGGGRTLKSTEVVLRPRRFPLPNGPVGAIAAKEFAYYRRDARLRGQMIGSLVGLVAVATVGVAALDSRYASFLAVPMAFFVVQALLVNQFGHDNGAFWSYLVAAPSIVVVLKGKNLAGGIFASVVSLAAGAVASVVAGDYRYLPAASFSAIVMVLLWAAVGNATSVIGPIRLTENSGFSSQGLSGSAFLGAMVGLLSAGILLMPAIVGVGLGVWLGGPAWATLVAGVASAYAAVVYRLSFRITGPLAERNVAKVLETIDRD